MYTYAAVEQAHALTLRCIPLVAVARVLSAYIAAVPSHLRGGKARE